MHLSRLVLAALLLVPFSAGAAPGQEESWTWLLGRLEDEASQEQYDAHARKMFEHLGPTGPQSRGPGRANPAGPPPPPRIARGR
jgi:hypothetical protein